MKLSMKWLSEFVKIDCSAHDYAAAMTMSGSKVESVEYPGESIQHVVVGKILNTHKHPDADRLTVCTLDVGAEKTLTIVTGAGNVREGQLVPVALDGALLPGGKEIHTGPLRGIESEGMMCSISELGLTHADVPYADEGGILILQEDCQIGEDIRRTLGLDDCVIDFEITSNRPDCLSMRGLARESAATFEKELTLPVPKAKGAAGDIHKILSVKVEDSSLCPRYTARMIKNVKIAPSPKWMRERLRACGVRPINNIVDITNYVMLEYGQPMHAFDYACVSGGEIVVRRAKNGEALETLDGQHRPLTGDMLVIADQSHPVGVAGVMGGANSEITDATNTVVFESANFNGSSIRLTAVSLNMRTDASARFEKGLDPENTIPAVERACELAELLGAGEVLGGIIDIDSTQYAPRVLPFEPDRMRRHIGADISEQQMRHYLSLLGFKVGQTSVEVPSWRADVEGMADISEEVARMFGYDKIPTTMFKGPILQGGLSDKQKAERQITGLCRGLGYSEIMTYSFISPSSYDSLRLDETSPLRDSLAILNPLGEDTSVMRTTALPSMLETLARNLNNRNPAARLYELASVYLKQNDQLPDERQMLMLGAYGDTGFYELKGAAEDILAGMNIPDIRFKALTGNPSYHPGRCAAVSSGQTPLGVVGQIHPLVAENYGADMPVFILELDFTRMLTCRAPEPVYKPLARFPSVTRDIAVVCERGIPVAELIDAIREGAGQLLETTELFDVYTGNQIQPGKKSAAFSLILRAAERTLTDSEADDAVNNALSLIKSRFGATLRV